MKTASLALAAALATIVGCAPPAAAQTQDQTGAATVDRAAPDDNGSAATNGVGNSEQRDDMRGEDRDNPADSANAPRQWRDRGPMVMPMRPMLPQRRMMMRGTGAHFHFARGKARIDVTCSPQEDTEACVRAAGELIDKIAELRGGANRDNTTGSADRDNDRSATQNDDDQDAPGERM
ncbi:MAG: hypothetical protein ACTHLO_04470 [Pseudolabrys sp.]